MKTARSRAVLVCVLLLLVAIPAAERTEAFLQRGPTGGETTGTPEIRLLCFGPSPYTLRNDSMRAGFGIYPLLQQVIGEHGLTLRATIYDAFPAVENADQGRSLLRGANVLALGPRRGPKARPTTCAGSSSSPTPSTSAACR